MIQENNNYNITVVGSGYVGMSLSVLLARQHNVTVLDICEERVKKINSRKSTVIDNDIESFFLNEKMNISATLDSNSAYENANFVIIATPTNFDENLKLFDTRSVDAVVKEAINTNPECFIVIKSTIPIGYTNKLQNIHNTNRIIFSPEFLREGQALSDNLNPSRIIIGGSCKFSKIFGELLSNAADKSNEEFKILYMPSTEAEAVKLFANSYLAMRVSYFNELDSFALTNNLNTKKIIDGISLDSRIGNFYNNPSFGYGGYCLPKDTKQLLSNFKDTPQRLVEAIVSSNKIRKDFISAELIKNSPKVIGFFKLAMKSGSDNFRSSASIDIIKRIQEHKIKTLIYEPNLKVKEYAGSTVINNLAEFKEKSDIIVSNRNSKDLQDVGFKCFTRDVFGNN